MRTNKSSIRRSARLRRGATMTETAIVLMIFLVLIFGMLDLGIMVARQQMLAQAARGGARAAIVRGEYADVLGSMGPTEITGYASDNHAVAAAARPYLVLMTPSNVRLRVTWPNGTNEFGEPVRVSTSADFTPIVTFIFGSPTWTLTGTSEMPIAH